MSLPSIVSYGAAAKTSSLVWDGDLVIPDGYAIESASGPVEISGGMSIAGHRLNVVTNTVSKSIVMGENTLPIVYSDGAKITGSVTLKNRAGNPQSASLTFYATDATGSLELLDTLNYRVTDSATQTYNVSVTVPVGTIGLQVAKGGSSYIDVDSTNMTVSNYTTSIVF